MITYKKKLIVLFWNGRRPSIRFKRCIGKKGDGGVGLIHLNTMIRSSRMKCGLKAINHLPTIWKFYAYQYCRIVLRSFAPWIWSDLIPHFDDNMSFFGDVAAQTGKWLKDGGYTLISNGEQTVYWRLIYLRLFQQPVC